MVAIALVFALDDIDWSVRRLAAALAVLFLFGIVGCVLGSMWYAAKDMFCLWED